MKKLKAKFGEVVEQEEEEEEDDEEEKDIQAQTPLALIEGMGEYQPKEETKVVEGTKGEEVEEAPTPTNQKKRKSKAQLVTKAMKVAKMIQPKSTTPSIRTSACVTTLKTK